MFNAIIFKDVDECDNNVCEHNCSNTDGSYLCSCNPGYRVDVRNKSRCRGNKTSFKATDHNFVRKFYLKK